MEEKSSTKFKDLFKSSNRQDLQEKRRKALLKEQKQQRSQLQDKLRGLKDIISTSRRKSDKTKQHKVPRTYVAKYGQPHTLQLSEWLREKPEDLQDWFLVPCPKGQRCLVIACDGYTEMYGKSGRLVCSFRSMLPGDRVCRSHVTILDCVFVEKQSKFFVLDALAYGNQEFLHCDAQFRFFWLTSKFQENPINEVSDYNEYAFDCLRFYDFANEGDIASCLLKYPQWEENSPELDGFLFYHKEASYTCGTTPLVGWLFPFMIPEVIDLPICEEYMRERPADYVDYLHFITVFDEELLKKRTNRRRSGGRAKMEQGEDENICDDDSGLDGILTAERELESGLIDEMHTNM